MVSTMIHRKLSVVTVAGICNWVSGGAFLTCHHNAGGEHWSASKLGLLIDIRITTSCWLLLLCFKLGHVVYYLDVICFVAFMGMQYAPCLASQAVLFPSFYALSQLIHQPQPPSWDNRRMSGSNFCPRRLLR